MFDYDFVRHVGTFRRGAWEGDGYQEVVRERARDGWRLVQVLVEQPAVMATDYVLIFERPAPGDPDRVG